MWQPTAMQCGHFLKRNVTTVWYDMIIIITVPIYRPFSISSKHVYTITFALVCMPSYPFLGASTAKARRVLTIQEEDRANERTNERYKWKSRSNGRLGNCVTTDDCTWRRGTNVNGVRASECTCEFRELWHNNSTFRVCSKNMENAKSMKFRY